MHYHTQRPMDIEWAKDGLDGKLYILQARPETVKSRSSKQKVEHYHLKQRSKILTEGRACSIYSLPSKPSFAHSISIGRW